MRKNSHNSRRTSPRKKTLPRLKPDRVWPLRLSRIFIGFGLIGIALLWMILNAHFGTNTSTPASTSTPLITNNTPRLGTLQHLQNLAIRVGLNGSVASAQGNQAPDGKLYTLIAVQVMNEGTDPIQIQAKDFQLIVHRGSNTQTLTGIPYRDNSTGLFHTSLAHDKTTTDVLAFLTELKQVPLAIKYMPASANPRTLEWRIS